MMQDLTGGKVREQKFQFCEVTSPDQLKGCDLGKDKMFFPTTINSCQGAILFLISAVEDWLH